MDAYTINEQAACINCDAPWDRLNPKGSSEADAYYCRCMDCGEEATYIFPKTCLNCDTEDWEHYESDDYPEDCPNCGAEEWGQE